MPAVRHPERVWLPTGCTETRATAGRMKSPETRINIRPGHSDTGADTNQIIIAVATTAEAKALRYDRQKLTRTGMGSINATRAAKAVLNEQTAGLVSLGTATALDANIKSGTVLLPGAIRWSDGAQATTDPDWRSALIDAIGSRLPIATGDLLQTDELIRTPAQKRRLHRDTGACGADMESGALAQVAAGAGIPFVALRVVLDTADDWVPETALSAVAADGNTRLVNLIMTLLRQPADIPGMIRLLLRFRTAAQSLKSAYSLIRPALQTPPHQP
jgi:adenosylhomocysteine nucleosidase